MGTVMHRSTILALTLAVLAAAMPARADGTQTTPLPSSQPANHVAIQGYDTVSYFTDGKPVKGDPAISMPFDDSTWQFADPSHKAMFAADPDRYMPQYGGGCAGGMTLGVSVPANPDNWVIVDGKLYLIAGSKTDLEEWRKYAIENIKAADEHWKKMLGQ